MAHHLSNYNRPRLLEGLVQALEDSDPFICADARFLLQNIGKPAMKYLLQAMCNGSMAAASVVAESGDPCLIIWLKNGLLSANRLEALTAVRALQVFGCKGQRVLIEGLKHSQDNFIKLYILKTLENISDSSISTQLEALLVQESSPLVRQSIDRLIQTLTGRHAQALQ